MMEANSHEKVCPMCNKVFYPEDKVVHKTFCGDELVCAPIDEKHQSKECRVYDFCSDECVEAYAKNTPECSYEPGWKKLMERINKVSKTSGVAGARPHNIRAVCK